MIHGADRAECLMNEDIQVPIKCGPGAHERTTITPTVLQRP